MQTHGIGGTRYWGRAKSAHSQRHSPIYPDPSVHLPDLEQCNVMVKGKTKNDAYGRRIGSLSKGHGEPANACANMLRSRNKHQADIHSVRHRANSVLLCVGTPTDVETQTLSAKTKSVLGTVAQTIADVLHWNKLRRVEPESLYVVHGR